MKRVTGLGKRRVVALLLGACVIAYTFLVRGPLRGEAWESCDHQSLSDMPCRACQDHGKRSKKPGDVKAHQQIRHTHWELRGTAYDPGTVYHHQRRGVGFAGSSPCAGTLGFLAGKGARP